MKEKEHRASEILKILGNPIRYMIFRIIGRKGAVSSRELANQLDKSMPSISRNLSLMKQENLLKSHRDGITSIYEIKRKDLLEKIIEFESLVHR